MTGVQTCALPISQAMKEELEDSKIENTSAKNFFTRATNAWNAGEIGDEVYEVIKQTFENHPKLLEGLRLSVLKAPEGKGHAAGDFTAWERLIRLFKNTSGTADPTTFRHELTHSLEQMMDHDARETLINAWYKDLSKAMEKYQDEEHKKYFRAILDFFANPTPETQRAAIEALPNESMYQYLNPSEYWAVNAETLMARHLSSGWGRFVNTMHQIGRAHV